MDHISQEVAEIVQARLAEFAKGKQTGMITVDVQVSQGEATAINTSIKENRKVSERRAKRPA